MVHRETTIYAEYDDALNYEKNEQVIAPYEKTRRDFQIRPRISKKGSVRRFVVFVVIRLFLDVAGGAIASFQPADEDVALH